MVNRGRFTNHDMELTQNLWERYGFTDNPYDIKALSLSKAAPLSVQEAYVERAEVILRVARRREPARAG